MAEYEDPATGEIYLVDELSDDVVAYHDTSAGERMFSGARKVLEQSAIVALARAYVVRVAPEFAASDPAYSERIVCQDASGNPAVVETTVTFRQRYRGLETVNYAEVTVNPQSGDVVSLLMIDGPLETDTSPGIAASDAEETVARAVRMPVHRLVGCTLFVWRAANSRVPVLAWRVRLKTGADGGGAEAAGVVDAHSGELLGTSQ